MCGTFLPSTTESLSPPMERWVFTRCNHLNCCGESVTVTLSCVRVKQITMTKEALITAVKAYVLYVGFAFLLLKFCNSFEPHLPNLIQMLYITKKSLFVFIHVNTIFEYLIIDLQVYECLLQGRVSDTVTLLHAAASPSQAWTTAIELLKSMPLYQVMFHLYNVMPPLYQIMSHPYQVAPPDPNPSTS